MTSWLTRLILFVLALEAGICVAFLAEGWEPLREKEDAIFARLLASSREGEEFVIDNPQPSLRKRLVRPMVPGTARTYLQVTVDERAAEDLHYPLEPEDWWGLFNHAHQVGSRIAAIEEPLSWKGEGVAHLGRLASLNTALSQFETVVLTVDLDRLQRSQPIPTYLQACAIPLSNVTGETNSLIDVNHVLFPPSVTPAPNVRFAFRPREGTGTDNLAILRWGDHIIPSFPLAVTMAQSNVSAHEVHINLGQNIRVGSGPMIPIDEFGALQIEPVNPPIAIERLAVEAYSPSQVASTRAAISEKTDTVPACVLFADPGSQASSALQKKNTTLQTIATLDRLPRPEGLETHQRLTLLKEIALLGMIAVVAALLLGLPAALRHLSYAGLLVAVPALLANLYLNSQQWSPFAPGLATALTGWILAIRMARYLPPRKRRESAPDLDPATAATID